MRIDKEDRDLAQFDQIRPGPWQTLRIALLNEFCPAKATYYHWYRNNFYRCNSKDGAEAECCGHVQRSWTCVCLALLYTDANADKAGSFARGSAIKYRVGYVGLARTVYQQLSNFETAAPGCDLWYSNSNGYSVPSQKFLHDLQEAQTPPSNLGTLQFHTPA